MKRTLLFLLANLALIATLGLLASLVCAFCGTSLQELLGPDFGTIVLYALGYGFVGSIVSLLLSKTMAKKSCGAKTIDGTEGEAERWLVATVRELAERANVRMPEVAIYPGQANAFATGAFRNSALVAVSTDIMGQMTKEELRAVLGHEMSHVANGDMVTMCLLQGVVNAFVIFFAYLFASVVSGRRDDNGRRGGHASFVMANQIAQSVLGLGGSVITMAFSRHREFAADAGSAKLLGTPRPMVAALRRLGNLKPGVLPESLKALGVASGLQKTLGKLLLSHPPLEDRIAALGRIG